MLVVRGGNRFLYVLALAHGRYYVGSTAHFPQRMQQHCDAAACAWTRKYPVVAIFSRQLVSSSIAGFLEDAKVLEMMARVGIDNVRGGTYNRMVLSTATVHEIRRKLWHNAGACTQCGSVGHFARNCGISQLASASSTGVLP